MADVITRLKVDSQEYDAKIKRATQSLNEMTTAAEREGSKIATANKENIALAQSLGKMATVSTTAKGKMGELTSAIEAATIQYNRLTAAERQSRFGKSLNASIGQLQTRLAGLKTEMAAVQTQMGKTSGMGIGAQLGQGFKSGMMMFGPQMAAMAGVMAAASGVKKVISDLVNTNKEFEQSNANLAAVMGKTRAETEALAMQAKQLGATTQWTAIQILDLQTNLARLGFTQQEILNSTSAVQALATATQSDLGEAASLAGSTLRAFGLDATEMDRVASVLAVSTTKSALSFEKLATAMPIVSPVAKQFGFTIEDTVTLLGKLSDAGMDASMAATATRNIFLKMANESGKLAQAMGRPVHSVEEFGEALKEMREKGMSLNDILQMVGIRGTAAFAVFADNAGTLKDFKESITGVGAELDKMVAEQLNTLEGSVIIMKSAWDGLMLSFTSSNGVLKSITDALGKLIQQWTNARNLAQGGEAAIGVYTKELSNKDKQGIREKVDAKLRNGSDINNIISGTDAYIKKLNQEEQKLVELSKKYDEYQKNRQTLQRSGDTNGVIKLMEQWEKELKNTSYTAQTISNIYEDIGKKRNKITQQEFVIEYAQSKLAPTEDPNKGKGLGGDGITAKRKAQIEATAKAEIAALDKVQMIKEGKEEEYEDRVYAIRKSALEQIAQLYADDTKEYAQVQAQKSQLDIQYQNTKLRLLRQSEREEAKLAKQAAKQDLSFSTTGISNLGNQIRQRVSGAGIGTQEYKDAAAQMVDFQSFQNLLQTAIKNGLDIDHEWLNSLFEDVKIGMDVDDSTWQAFVDSINEKLAGLDLPPIELDVKTGNVKALDNQIGSLEQNLEGAINVFGQLGQAMQEIDDPGAKVAGIIMSAIANIAGTFAASLKGTFTPWDWIAAAISGTATMISTIAAIKSATSGAKGYASGGMVGGNSYSGDNIVARLNSGEGVLTAKGVQNAAAMASNTNPMQNLQLFTEVSGTNLRIVLNNDNRSKGGSRGYYANIH